MDLFRLLIEDDAFRAWFMQQPEQKDAALWTEGDSPHMIDFGNLTTNGFTLVDQFDGKFPRFFNASHNETPTLSSTFPTIVLDSDVSTHIADYIEGTLHRGDLISKVRHFLEWFAATPRMNVHPGYNLLERVARSSKENAMEWGVRTCRAILAVETMDRAHYRATGISRPAAEAAEYLLGEFGTTSLEDAATKQLSAILNFKGDTFEPHYCFLLKVPLIHAKRPKKAELNSKLAATINFINKKFGTASPIEMGIALTHYSAGFDRFIHLNRNTSFEENQARVVHAAWDLRVPASAHGRNPTRSRRSAENL